MEKRMGLVLAVGVSAFVLVAITVDLFRPSVSPLKQRVMEDMQDIQYLPQERCSLVTPLEGRAEYEAARETALANLLSAPEAQALSLPELEAVFAGGIQAALDIEDGAQFLDEQNGAILVSMKQPFCSASHRFSFFPPLYIFNREGDFWALGDGRLFNVQWMEDRWVGFFDNVSGGYPIYYFSHILLDDGWWKIRIYSDVVHGPALIFNQLPTIEFMDNYRKLFIPAQNKANFALFYNPAPCDFGDSFSTLTSLDSCEDCEISFLHAQYWGDFTLVYEDGRYLLTDETPYNVRVVLSDSSYLNDVSPSSEEVSDSLRAGSWHDYCVVGS